MAQLESYEEKKERLALKLFQEQIPEKRKLLDAKNGRQPVVGKKSNSKKNP
jgi:hypothetical protein